MSTPENDIWLETAKDNFDEAVSVKDWELAKVIIADVRDNGFVVASTNMQEELDEAREEEILKD